MRKESKWFALVIVHGGSEIGRMCHLHMSFIVAVHRLLSFRIRCFFTDRDKEITTCLDFHSRPGSSSRYKLWAATTKTLMGHFRLAITKCNSVRVFIEVIWKVIFIEIALARTSNYTRPASLLSSHLLLAEILIEVIWLFHCKSFEPFRSFYTIVWPLKDFQSCSTIDITACPIANVKSLNRRSFCLTEGWHAANFKSFIAVPTQFTALKRRQRLRPSNIIMTWRLSY